MWYWEVATLTAKTVHSFRGVGLPFLGRTLSSRSNCISSLLSESSSLDEQIPGVTFVGALFKQLHSWTLPVRIEDSSQTLLHSPISFPVIAMGSDWMSMVCVFPLNHASTVYVNSKSINHRIRWYTRSEGCCSGLYLVKLLTFRGALDFNILGGSIL